VLIVSVCFICLHSKVLTMLLVASTAASIVTFVAKCCHCLPLRCHCSLLLLLLPLLLLLLLLDDRRQSVAERIAHAGATDALAIGKAESQTEHTLAMAARRRTTMSVRRNGAVCLWHLLLTRRICRYRWRGGGLLRCLLLMLLMLLLQHCRLQLCWIKCTAVQRCGIDEWWLLLWRIHGAARDRTERSIPSGLSARIAPLIDVAHRTASGGELWIATSFDAIERSKRGGRTWRDFAQLRRRWWHH
jgi:hypothetical protein